MIECPLPGRSGKRPILAGFRWSPLAGVVIAVRVVPARLTLVIVLLSLVAQGEDRYLLRVLDLE